MNIILFSGSSAPARHITLSMPALLIVGVMGMASVGAGVSYLFSGPSQKTQSLAEVEQLRLELKSQQDVLAELHNQSQDQLDALAMRLGELNAKAIRLDALGRRLTAMGDLDTGEFDFSATPGLGGPGITPGRCP